MRPYLVESSSVTRRRRSCLPRLILPEMLAARPTARPQPSTRHNVAAHCVRDRGAPSEVNALAPRTARRAGWTRRRTLSQPLSIFPPPVDGGSDQMSSRQERCTAARSHQVTHPPELCADQATRPRSNRRCRSKKPARTEPPRRVRRLRSLGRWSHVREFIEEVPGRVA